MKKILVVLVTVLSLCVTAASSFAQSDWKTVVSEAIEFGGLVDSTMMEDALQYAISEGIPLSEFLAEVKATNPEAVEIALKSSFNVVEDKSSVIAAALDAQVEVGLVVATAIAANVPAGEVVTAAIEADAPASEAVAAAVQVDATTASEVVAAAITAGASVVEVVASAMDAGADVIQVTHGATMAGVSEEAVAVAVETAQTALAYTTVEDSTEQGRTPARNTTVPIDTTPPEDVSPN